MSMNSPDCPKCNGTMTFKGNLNDYLPDIVIRKFKCSDPDCGLTLEQTLSHSEWEVREGERVRAESLDELGEKLEEE